MLKKTIKVIILIFPVVWFFVLASLLKNTFFFHDEWTFLYSLIVSPVNFILSPHNGHFMPLFNVFYFIEYELFKLNYFPYQLILLIFHFANGIILYLIIKKITNSKKWGAVAFYLFMTNAMYWEVLFSSSTLPTILCLFFIELSLLFYLKFNENKSNLYLTGSALSAFLSGISWGAGIFFPLIIFVSLFISKFFGKKVSRKDLTAYLITGIFSITVYKLFVHNGIVIDLKKIIIFTYTAIKWIIISCFTSSPGLVKIFAGIVFLIILILFLLIKNDELKKKLFKINSESKFWVILSVMNFICIYLISAISRYEIDMQLSKSSRYTYIPLFFLIIISVIFFNRVYSLVNTKIRIGMTVYFLALIFANLYFFRIYYISWVETISQPNKKTFDRIINAKSDEELNSITFPSTFHSFFKAKQIYFIYINSNSK